MEKRSSIDSLNANRAERKESSKHALQKGTSMKSVLFYGAAKNVDLERILEALPFKAEFVSIASEFFCASWGFKIDWDGGGNAPRRRNCEAAAACNAVVIIRKPKFSTAVVRIFRLRGRRVFWWSGKALHEVEVSELIACDRSKLPVEGTFEPDLWNARKPEQIFTPFDWARLRGQIQAFYPVGKLRYDAILSSINREEVDAIQPLSRNWAERVNDVDCDSTDVLHSSNDVPGIAVDVKAFLLLVTCWLLTVQNFISFQMKK